MTLTMDTIRTSNRGRLEVMGKNNAVRWAIRLSRRDEARRRLRRIRHSRGRATFVAFLEGYVLGKLAGKEA